MVSFPISTKKSIASGLFGFYNPQKCVRTAILAMSSTMRVEKLLAKTENFGQTQFLDFLQGLLEFFALMKIFRQKQNILTAVPGQFGRQKQEVGTNRIQRGPEIFSGQTKPFEPMDNIGREQKQLKEGDVGLPGIAGNFGQRIIVKEFAVVLLYSSSGIVEQIHAPGRHRQIGHENRVDVFGILEQSQLLGFLRVFGNRTSNHDKPMRGIPFLMNVFEELADFPAIVELLETASLRSGLDGGIFFGHDDVPAARFIEKSDNPLTVKSRIHSKTNPSSGDIPGRFGEANFQKADCSRGGHRIAWPQRAVPELLAVRLETKHRVITPSSRLLGVVTDSASLLLAVKCDHHRIDIEGQTRWLFGQCPQMRPQTVMQSDQLPNRLRTQTLQKPAQSCLIRETAQSQHLQKETVVLQDLGPVDSLHAHDDRVQQGQDQFGRMVLGLIVGVMPGQTLLNLLLEIDLFAKTMNQTHPTEVRQVGPLEEKSDVSGSFGHEMQTVHFGRFLSQGSFEAYYTRLSSENINSKSQNHRIARFFEVDDYAYSNKKNS